MKYNLLIGLFCWMSLTAAAQTIEVQPTIQAFLDQEHKGLSLERSDVNSWIISSQHRSKQSGVTHVYIQQTHQGIPLFNGVANFALKDGKVVSMGNRLVPQIANKAGQQQATVSPQRAIELAATALNLPSPQALEVVSVIDAHRFEYGKSNISLEDIPVQLLYWLDANEELQLVWDLSIYQLDAQHWWSVRIDAQTGALLDKNDWVLHCQFDGMPAHQCSHKNNSPLASPTMASPNSAGPNQYRVIALPAESPSHGPSVVINDPHDSLPSPFGWHDVNGVTGAEYTITRGNNVHAYEDTLDNNAPGGSPDGGLTLDFAVPYVNAAPPVNNLAAATVNLFYMNNMMHDIWYRYGFDEASGNFQTNNYGRGGSAGDYVRAEAQDGSGTSNANFATPPDGNRPRMQMYIWPMGSSTGHYLTVSAPSNLAGTYLAAKASFGPLLPAIPLSADLVLIEDAIAPSADGCDSILNGSVLNNKIVLIDQGICGFGDKVEAAQNAGAVGVVIVSNLGFLFVMSSSNPNITIPSIMVLPSTGNNLKTALQAGVVTVALSNAGISDKDSDFDNGIIAHEYGHGISNRLTGGGAASNCLRNAEQMGEGWSDWFGLMLTIEPGDQGSDIRGIGTHVTGEPTTGTGIRPAPYSTDRSINNYTYANSNNSNISQPHGVGFIFATVLWDLTWELVDFYGGTPDPDLFNGTGGNNIAMNLVIEGLKLQPCSPGMIDGRDAILQADQLLYNGAHECIIWEVFAARGFGYSASQGSSASRLDQVEAFDISPVCMVAAAPPVASFVPSALNSCAVSVSFQDSSYSTPHQWFWNFGDGGTSTDQNPTHTYALNGPYTVRLIVSNNMGNDTAYQQITITAPPAPIALDDEVCLTDTATLVASGTGYIQWKDISNRIIHQGDTLLIPSLGSVQTYYAENVTNAPLQTVGPADTSIGTTFINNSDAYYGALNFKAQQALELVSTEVYSTRSGLSTFFLSSGKTTNGATATNIIDAVTVFLQVGQQQINLNLNVPDTGWYSLSAEDVSLVSNNSGVMYPYTIPGLIELASSSAADSIGSHHYFYDLIVRQKPCVSLPDTALAYPVNSAFTYTDTNNTYYFVDQSSDARSWFWDFGDGNTSTQQNPVHTYANGNPRTITLTINNGSCSSSQNTTVIIGVHEPNFTPPTISIYPNPTNNWVAVDLSRATKEDLTLQIYTITGQVLQTATLKAGTAAFTLDVEDLPSGIYNVHIQGLQFSESRLLRVE
ncbi:MAG: T9SS-dependent M36 family metallopeptidase [Aureispira sp.]